MGDMHELPAVLCDRHAVQMDLLGVVVKMDPLRAGPVRQAYYDARPYWARRVHDHAYLCTPDKNPGVNMAMWPIAVFSTAEACCEAVLNPKKFGLAWDEGNN